MDITTEDFRRHFDLLSDEALLDTRRDELTEVAQRCLDEELEKRGLHAAEEEVLSDEPVADEPSPEEEELVVVATYDDAEEADGAKAQLDEAKIPSRLVKDASDMEGTQLELLVPVKGDASFRDHPVGLRPSRRREKATLLPGGTGGSNPAPSSGESGANLIFGDDR